MTRAKRRRVAFALDLTLFSNDNNPAESYRFSDAQKAVENVITTLRLDNAPVQYTISWFSSTTSYLRPIRAPARFSCDPIEEAFSNLRYDLTTASIKRSGGSFSFDESDSRKTTPNLSKKVNHFLSDSSILGRIRDAVASFLVEFAWAALDLDGSDSEEEIVRRVSKGTPPGIKRLSGALQVPRTEDMVFVISSCVPAIKEFLEFANGASSLPLDDEMVLKGNIGKELREFMLQRGGMEQEYKRKGVSLHWIDVPHINVSNALANPSRTDSLHSDLDLLDRMRTYWEARFVSALNFSNGGLLPFELFSSSCSSAVEDIYFSALNSLMTRKESTLNGILSLPRVPMCISSTDQYCCAKTPSTLVLKPSVASLTTPPPTNVQLFVDEVIPSVCIKRSWLTEQTYYCRAAKLDDWFSNLCHILQLMRVVAIVRVTNLPNRNASSLGLLYPVTSHTATLLLFPGTPLPPPHNTDLTYMTKKQKPLQPTSTTPPPSLFTMDSCLQNIISFLLTNQASDIMPRSMAPITVPSSPAPCLEMGVGDPPPPTTSSALALIESPQASLALVTPSGDIKMEAETESEQPPPPSPEGLPLHAPTRLRRVYSSLLDGTRVDPERLVEEIRLCMGERKAKGEERGGRKKTGAAKKGERKTKTTKKEDRVSSVRDGGGGKEAEAAGDVGLSPLKGRERSINSNNETGGEEVLLLTYPDDVTMTEGHVDDDDDDDDEIHHRQKRTTTVTSHDADDEEEDDGIHPPSRRVTMPKVKRATTSRRSRVNKDADANGEIHLKAEEVESSSSSSMAVYVNPSASLSSQSPIDQQGTWVVSKEEMLGILGDDAAPLRQVAKRQRRQTTEGRESLEREEEGEGDASRKPLIQPLVDVRKKYRAEFDPKQKTMDYYLQALLRFERARIANASLNEDQFESAKSYLEESLPERDQSAFESDNPTEWDRPDILDKTLVRLYWDTRAKEALLKMYLELPRDPHPSVREELHVLLQKRRVEAESKRVSKEKEEEELNQKKLDREKFLTAKRRSWRPSIGTPSSFATPLGSVTGNRAKRRRPVEEEEQTLAIAEGENNNNNISTRTPRPPPGDESSARPEKRPVAVEEEKKQKEEEKKVRKPWDAKPIESRRPQAPLTDLRQQSGVVRGESGVSPRTPGGGSSTTMYMATTGGRFRSSMLLKSMPKSFSKNQAVSSAQPLVKTEEMVGNDSPSGADAKRKLGFQEALDEKEKTAASTKLVDNGSSSSVKRSSASSSSTPSDSARLYKLLAATPKRAGGSKSQAKVVDEGDDDELVCPESPVRD